MTTSFAESVLEASVISDLPGEIFFFGKLGGASASPSFPSPGSVSSLLPASFSASFSASSRFFFCASAFSNSAFARSRPAFAFRKTFPISR